MTQTKRSESGRGVNAKCLDHFRIGGMLVSSGATRRHINLVFRLVCPCPEMDKAISKVRRGESQGGKYAEAVEQEANSMSAACVCTVE